MKGTSSKPRDEQLTTIDEHEHWLQMSPEIAAVLAVSNKPRNSDLVCTVDIFCILNKIFATVYI